jgi:hypothetical protein
MKERVVISMFEGVAGTSIKDLTSFLSRAQISMPPDIWGWTNRRSYTESDNPEYIFETTKITTSGKLTHHRLSIVPKENSIKRIFSIEIPTDKETNPGFPRLRIVKSHIDYTQQQFSKNLKPYDVLLSYEDIVVRRGEQNYFNPRPIILPETMSIQAHHYAFHVYDFNISHTFPKPASYCAFIARDYGLDININGTTHSIDGNDIEKTLHEPNTVINDHWNSVVSNARDIFEITLPGHSRVLWSSIVNSAQLIVAG